MQINLQISHKVANCHRKKLDWVFAVCTQCEHRGCRMVVIS